MIIQLRERCDYSLSFNSFNYHSITLQMQKTEGGKKRNIGKDKKRMREGGESKNANGTGRRVIGQE